MKYFLEMRFFGPHRILAATLPPQYRILIYTKIKSSFMVTLTLLDSETRSKKIVMPPYRVITSEQSRMMRYLYRDGTLVRNSKSLGKTDSTSVLLSKQTLLQLVEACDGKHNCIDGSDGILAHWATYPQDHPNPDLAGRQTLVFEVLGTNLWFGDMPICPPWCNTSDGLPCPKQ